MLACPASFFKKDSRQAPLEKIFLMGQAGMTVSVILLMNSLVTLTYSLRLLAYITFDKIIDFKILNCNKVQEWSAAKNEAAQGFNLLTIRLW